MSTVTKAISSVEFHVNARQANAALQSIQEEAKRCREQVEELQEQAAKGVTTVKVDGMDVDIQKRIKEVKALQKTWESAAQSQIKGAKAFDELWKNARMGTIESMTGAQIKAGVNASKPIYDRLRLGDAEDRMKAQAIKDMQDQGQKVLNQLKTTTDQIIKQIADGETIAADVLEREARNLKSIMDLLPPLSQEWKDYNLQYQAINQQIERQTVLERQLRGEIVTREDAIRVVNAANREATQQEIAQEEQRAKAAREAAEAKAAEADQYRTTVEQKQSEIFATNDLIAAKRREIDAHHESAAAAKDAADKARDAAYKDRKQAEQEARNQQDAYNKQKKIRDDAAKDVEKFRKELEKLGEVKAEPKIDTSALDAMKQELTDIENQLTSMGGMHTADMKAFNERLWHKQEKMKEVGEQHYKPLTSDPDADYFNFGNKAKKIIKSFAAGGDDRRHDLMYSLAERGGYLEKLKELESEHRAIVKQRTEYMRAMDETGKRDWEEAIRQLDELDSQYSTVIAVLKDYKQQFDKIKPADDAHVEKYEQLTERRAILLEKMASVEQQSSAAQQQSTTATAAQTDAIKAQEQELEKLNQKIQKLKQDGMYDPAEGSVQDAIAERKRLISDYEKEAEKASRGMDRSKEGSKTYEKHWEEWSDADQWRESYEIQLKALQELEKAEKEKLELEQRIATAQQQSTTATDAQSEAYQKLEKQLSDAKRDLAEIAEDERKANEALKQFGITTADITDDAKLQAAAEKALKEEEESRLELAKQMLQVRKQIGQEELKDSRIVGSKDTQAFYAKNKGVLDDEYWKSEAGGGSISRMYKYLNDISDDPEAKAEFKEQVGMTVKDAMRVAGQRMREVVQEAMKRGIKIDDALSDFADGYGHGPATKIEEFLREFNETVGDKEDELIKKRREKLDAIADVVYEPGEEMASRDERLRLAKESLKGVGEGYYGSGKPLSESYKEQQAEVTRLESEMKKLSETSQQSAQSSEQLAQKQEQLSQKTAELNQQQDKLNGMVDETVTANQQAAQAANTHQQSVKALGDVMEENRKTGQRLGEEMGELTKQHKQQTEELAEASEKMTDAEKESNRHIKTEQEARLRIQQLNNQSIEQLTASLRVFEEENRRINDPGNQRWQENERYIGQLNLRLEELKKQSAELRREPVLDMMTQRMDQLGTLSRDALTETKKFWQAMYDGAENNDEELKKIEQRLKDIGVEEQKRDRKTLEERAARLQNVDNYSVGELREGIEAAKRLQDQYRLTNDEVQQLSTSIVAAETRIAKVGVEAERQAQRQREQIDLMQQQLSKGSSLTESALKAQENFWQRLADDPKAAAEAVKQYTANLEEVHRLQKENSDKTIRERAARLDNVDSYSVGEIQDGIDAAKKMQQTFHLSEEELTNLSKKIVDAETRIAKVGVEAERQAQRQREQIELMQQQLSNGSALTESALKAQVNYWQRLADDPKAAAEAVAQYTANMKQAQDLLDQSQRADIESKAGRLDNMDGYSVSELREGIDAAKKMQDTFRLSNDEVQQLSEKIVAAEVRISQFSVESERQAQRQREQIALMEQQLANGSALTESALKAQVNYWQRLADDPKAAAEAVAQYTANMKQAQDLLDQSQRADIESKAGRLQNLGAYSVSEIREGIDAAKKMQDTFHLTDAEVQQLSEDIVAAEKHVSQFSVENERAAQKQREQVATMEQQLQGMTNQMAQHNSVSVNVLKAQHSYWQKLIDDPKTAAENLQQYQDNLAETERLQRRMVRKQGQEALDWFRGGMDADASANDIKEQAAAMKAWRDTLPKETQADVIADIDGYLKKAGVSAKGATEEMMELVDAMVLADKAGTAAFAATPQEMQLATKALEKQRDTIIATIREKRNLGQATKAEEDQLADLTKKLRSLKFEQDNVNMSQEKMRTLIETPANAVNLDELRAAIKRADGQLRQMQQSLGENSDEYKRFAEQVRNAKNVMKEMEGQAKASATAWEKAFNRLKTYVVMYMGFNSLWQKVSGTLGDMMQLSDRMGEVGKTTQMTAEQVGKLTDRLRDLDTRTTLVALTELSAKAGQLGLKTEEDILGFTEAANKMLVALPEMGADGATQMMKVALATGEVNRIKKDMDKGLIEGSSATAVAMEKIASTIDQLRANSAAAAPQITDFVKRVGAVGAQSGITIDQVAALGSTVDALGMRVEMSATALSRMIPAIKNNAFEVAKAIGMAPEALRKMFDEAGGGMNAMLAIFQHIKDAGMNPDDIEKMLGMGGMQDIMKDLNQQGARAGIVFAGLSQNVDVLREHLGIAHDAYEENIAIQQEYDRMNETTAAKWERLANKVEEMFVGSGTQSALGKIYDMLTWIVDLITGPLNTAFLSATGAVLAIKSGLTEIPSAVGNVFDYLKDSAAKASEALEKAANATSEISEAAEGVEEAGDAVGEISDALGDAKEAGEQAGEAMESATGAIEGMTGATKVSIFSVKGLKAAWKGLDTTMKANIIVAVIALLYTLGKAIYNVVTEIGKNNKAVAEANAMIQVAIDRFEGYWQKLKDTATALDQAREKTKKLKEGSEELTKATVDVTKADNAHRTAIANMNSIYGKYLGFMLTEQNYALLNAAAHDKVTAAIRREMLAKQQQAAIDQVTQENTENLKTGLANLTEELREDGRLNTEQAAQAKRAVQKFMRENIKFSAGGDATISNEAYKYLQSKGANRGKLKGLSVDEFAAAWFYEYLEDNFHLDKASLADITGVFPQGGGYRNTNKLGRNFRGDYASAYSNYMQEIVETQDVFAGETADAEKKDRDATQKLVKKLQQDAKNAQSKILNKGASQQERNQAYEQLANALEGLDTNIDQLNPVSDKTLIEGAKQLADNIAKTVDSGKLTRARSNARSIFARATNGSNVETQLQSLDPEKNIWGNRLPAESTDWKNMTAEQLVNRRKQMKDFVNAIQTDTDVKAVLAEDKALVKAFKGRQATMREVVEWYNQQRLLIQDELHARHLTNTGDWMDPKKERGARKQFRDEMDAYLHELDAYYTERKTRIEEAGTDEGLTEAEIRNRTLANEMEWQQRRAELQKLYSRKQKEVTQEELDAIYHIISERTGDTESFVKAQIAKTNQFVDAIEKSGDKGAAIVHRWMSQVELDTERSYLKGQQALTKQMKAIEDIIDKERPFNGITKQLRESLSTMDILTGDMRKEYDELMKAGKDMRDFNERQGRAELQRTTFLLGQAEQAYSTTIDRVMQQMREKGMGQWADWLAVRPEQQEALMAQLRQTYDAIQDAIKKEASQLKKQAEIMWNNILVPGGDGKTTLKQMLDRTVAQLGIDQGRVSRANSLIGAGASSERVADKLAIQQMRLQLTMQEHYYNLMKKQGRAHVDMLNQQADAAERRGNAEEATRKRLDAQHAEMALNLATAKEETELAKQREEIIARTEESQNRLYTELREWADLLTSSLQGVFEASHAGDAEYYNERAKLDLTGKGGPGAGTYTVIDDAGTSDAKAHYEYLDERQALERQHEIEIQNAQAEAWRKLMDDLNMKMSEQITDWINAMLQNASIDANTDELEKLQTKLDTEQAKIEGNVQALGANTDAMSTLTGAVNGLATVISGAGSSDAAYKEGGNGQTVNGGNMGVDENGVPNALQAPVEAEPATSSYWPRSEEDWNRMMGYDQAMWDNHVSYGTEKLTEMSDYVSQMPSVVANPVPNTEEELELLTSQANAAADVQIEASRRKTEAVLDDQKKVKVAGAQTDQQMTKSSQSAFAKITQAANMYGIAYQAMSNDNLSATQKFEMMAVQAAGQAAIAMLTTDLAAGQGKTAAQMPGILGQCIESAGPYLGPVLFAAISGVLGGLLGMAVSKIAKGKSEIAQVTGTSASAGRLSTGMLTYAEGNVNELTDPASLTPGRQYNVDGADGKTYRAKYMGKGAKTHITNGPEFHLVGEAGREAIIDAKTTRLLQMNETGIWRDIQTLYNGGSIAGMASRRRRGGVRAFADGNVGEFEEMADGGGLTAEGTGGMGMEQMLTALDRNSAIQEALLERLNKPIVAQNILYGPDGLPNVINKLNKEAQRHGEKYL